MKKILVFLLLVASSTFAARDFDGTNDNIAFGSDASIDAYALRTYSFWMQWNATGLVDNFVTKSANNTTSAFSVSSHTTDVMRLNYSWSVTAPAIWIGSTTISGGTSFYVTISYDNQLVTNNPIIRIGCAGDTVTETSAAPTLTPSSDAANTLRLGETDSGAGDLDGRIGWFNYDDTLWDQATCNRGRWWGTPGGGIDVYHPLVTDKLLNQGTATADGTATGTTVVDITVPVVRPGSALLNDGIGW